MTGDVPTAAISRLVTYLRLLEDMDLHKQHSTSSSDLAERAQVTAFQVRKDLAYFGRFGTRGMGYSVPVLRRELLRVLGLNRVWNVVIIGMGRLGQAVANYPGASDYRFGYVGLFDVSPEVVGQTVRGLTVQHVDELPAFVQARAAADAGATDPRHLRQEVDMGFLAVPPERAQAAAEQMVRAGIRGILNFAPVVIQQRDVSGGGTGEGLDWSRVTTENVDFLAGMKRLAFYTLNPSLRQPDAEEQ